jgi:hypothetical protein
MPRWVRWVFEYVGNVTFRKDRRKDTRARLLMDHIRHEMSKQGLSEAETTRRVEQLRESVREVGPEQAR